MEQFWDCIIMLGDFIQENAMVIKGDIVRQNVLSKEFEDEVKEMYIDKNLEELEELEKEIEETLNGNEFDVMDYEYWQNIQKLIKNHKCKVILKGMYEDYEKNLKGK